MTPKASLGWFNLIFSNHQNLLTTTYLFQIWPFFWQNVGVYIQLLGHFFDNFALNNFCNQDFKNNLNHYFIFHVFFLPQNTYENILFTNFLFKKQQRNLTFTKLVGNEFSIGLSIGFVPYSALQASKRNEFVVI